MHSPTPTAPTCRTPALPLFSAAIRSLARSVASLLAGVAVVLGLACVTVQAQTTPAAKPVADADGWMPLFNGRNLDGWKLTKFGGDGEVEVVEGELILNQGGPLTGVTWTKAFPKVDFEISLEAQRVEGTDFFVGLTFPVRDSHASLIVGGWAGSVVGISSLDGRDASENETTQVMKFDNGKWYKFRVRVTADRIKAWIDEAPVVDVSIKDRKVTTRNEVTLSQPVGLATYDTKAAIRKLRYRVVKP